MQVPAWPENFLCPGAESRRAHRLVMERTVTEPVCRKGESGCGRRCFAGDSRNSTGITGQRWSGREGGRCRRWTCRRRSAVTPCCCPAAGDVEPWRYGQTDTVSRGLEPERDRGGAAHCWSGSQRRAGLCWASAGGCRCSMCSSAAPCSRTCRATARLRGGTGYTGCGRRRRRCGSCTGRMSSSTAPTTRRRTGWAAGSGQSSGRRTGGGGGGP